MRLKLDSFSFYVNIFAAKVKVTVIQKVWLIGDAFLQRIYHSYGTLRDQARISRGKLKKPYLLDAYTVSSHIMGELNGIQSTAARMQNCLVRQLDTTINMPRYIVFIPDNDVIKGSSGEFYDFGASKMSQEIMAWMIDEYFDQITKRKKELRDISLGAVLPGEPKIVYVKMIYRPRKDEIQAVRNHFNNALQNSLYNSKLKNHFIMEIEVHPSKFDHTNCLTDEGKADYWSIFDANMKELDEGKNEKFMKPQYQEVKPRKQVNQTTYRLPPPPPQARKRLTYDVDIKHKPKHHGNNYPRK